MNGTKEHRQHQRFEHRAKIEVWNDQETIVAYTKNLSDTGLFIIGQFAVQPELGDMLTVLVLGINDAIARPVIVRRIEPGVGLAVEFTGV